jgi:signal transduction histidine kinase
VTAADDLRRAPLPIDLDRLLHDLRGPLNGAVLHLQALKRLVAGDPAAQGSLQSIQKELDRLTAMLPVAFSVCALEMGARRRLPLRSVVESAIDEAARKRVRVEPGPWPEIDGDERLLVLAMAQLLANALEAGGDDGEVHVTVEPAQAGTVAVVIHDAGSGFKIRNPNAVVRLMASTKPGHVGIGLLVAQRIARLHGGTLTVETAPDGAGIVRFSVAAPPPA